MNGKPFGGVREPKEGSSGNTENSEEVKRVKGNTSETGIDSREEIN